jgi:FXSXX-COOH protein
LTRPATLVVTRRVAPGTLAPPRPSPLRGGVVPHPAKEQPVTQPPPRRPHTPLAAINPRGQAAVRAVGRVADIPGRRPVKPITFDSAI